VDEKRAEKKPHRNKHLKTRFRGASAVSRPTPQRRSELVREKNSPLRGLFVLDKPSFLFTTTAIHPPDAPPLDPRQ
jgi:hypothetical protein